jgi:hypothetical protein
VPSRAIGHLNAGVAERDVDTPEPLDPGLNHRRRLCFVGHVAWHCDCCVTRVGRLAGNGLQRLAGNGLQRGLA